MGRRSRLELYLDVLGAVKRGIDKPTCIMYEANLSWKPLKRLLGHMMDMNLVEEIDLSGTRRRDKRTDKNYRLTQKGENVIRYFNEARITLNLEDVIPMTARGDPVPKLLV